MAARIAGGGLGRVKNPVDQEKRPGAPADGSPKWVKVFRFGS